MPKFRENLEFTKKFKWMCSPTPKHFPYSSTFTTQLQINSSSYRLEFKICHFICLCAIYHIFIFIPISAAPTVYHTDKYEQIWRRKMLTISDYNNNNNNNYSNGWLDKKNVVESIAVIRVECVLEGMKCVNDLYQVRTCSRNVSLESNYMKLSHFHATHYFTHHTTIFAT